MSFSSVLDILTRNYALIQYNEEYLLVDKHTKTCVGFAFSDRYARASGDRGAWHRICEFDSLEKNAVGLAAYLEKYCTDPFSVSQERGLFTKYYNDLQKEKTETETRLILQNSFQAQSWDDISCQSPNGNITGKIVFCRHPSNSSIRQVLCILDGMKLKVLPYFEGTPGEYGLLFKKIVRINDGLAFIEKACPEADTEFILQLLSIIISGHTALGDS